ncbi:MAG: hypothetical protein J1E34_00010 [Oscillospiraceae bacterium]|nr:hypothetical protein [Oscillospiraceae bacterium]
MPSARRDAISAVGITVIENGEITDNYYTLVDPECEFDDYTVELTGITPEMVREYPNFSVLWDEIRPYLENAVLAAHGAQGDLHVLSRTLKRYGISWLENVNFICTFEAAKKCLPDLPGYSLNKISESLEIPLRHHLASSDSFAAAMILIKCAEKNPEILSETKQYSIKSASSVTKAKKKNKSSALSIEKDLRSFVVKKFSVMQKKGLRGKTKYAVLGVKPGVLKKYSAKVICRPNSCEFTQHLPHTFYEENLLHAYIIDRSRDFDFCLNETSGFLPFIDDDTVFFALNPKALGQNRKTLYIKCDEWFRSENMYERAFAVKMFARWFTEKESFSEELSEKIAAVNEDGGAVFLCASDYFFRLMKFGSDEARAFTHKAAEYSRAAERGIEFFCSDEANEQISGG